MKSMVFVGCLLAFLSLAVAQTPAQDVLDNQAIIKLVKAGLSEDIIVSLIKTREGRYSTGPDDLVALKAAGVPDSVISAIVHRASSSPGSQTDLRDRPAADRIHSEPSLKMGIYYRRGEDWVAIPDEPMNMRTGGALMKAINPFANLSGYIVLEGPHSKTELRRPTEFLVVAPNGIQDLSLVRLDQKKDRRELRVVRGRVNISTGVEEKNQVRFNAKEIGPGRHRIDVDLAPGEYAFLFLQASAHTFRVLE